MTQALRAVYQIEKSLNRRLPELRRLAMDPEIPKLLVEELFQVATKIDQEISAAERRGEKKLMMRGFVR